MRIESTGLYQALLLFLLVGCGHNASNLDPPAASATPAAPATPAASATVFDNIQQWTGWLTCGNCGNSGAQGATATYQMTRGITSPSESGSSADFSIGGTYPYTNAYWYYRHQPRSTAMSSLIYELDIYVPVGNENAPQAIEFECQQRLNGYIYNFAWQADYVINRWRLFNYSARLWEDSGIPLQRFTPGSWHHIAAEYHNDGTAHTTYHDALTIDGVRQPVNVVHQAAPISTQGNDFTNAFQLDLNGTPVPFSVYVDKLRVTQVD